MTKLELVADNDPLSAVRKVPLHVVTDAWPNVVYEPHSFFRLVDRRQVPTPAGLLVLYVEYRREDSLPLYRERRATVLMTIGKDRSDAIVQDPVTRQWHGNSRVAAMDVGLEIPPGVLVENAVLHVAEEFLQQEVAKFVAQHSEPDTCQPSE